MSRLWKGQEALHISMIARISNVSTRTLRVATTDTVSLDPGVHAYASAKESLGPSIETMLRLPHQSSRMMLIWPSSITNTWLVTSPAFKSRSPTSYLRSRAPRQGSAARISSSLRPEKSLALRRTGSCLRAQAGAFAAAADAILERRALLCASAMRSLRSMCVCADRGISPRVAMTVLVSSFPRVSMRLSSRRLASV